MEKSPRRSRLKGSKTRTSQVEPLRDRRLPLRGSPMSKTEKSRSWVVYRMTIQGKTSDLCAVCDQREWEAMERAQPGFHTLIRAGITNEGEAERLARSGPADGSTNQPAEPMAPPRYAS